MMIDNPLEIPYIFERILNVFRKHQIYFFLLLSAETILNVILTIFTWNSRGESIKIMENIYSDIHYFEAFFLFYSIYCANIMISVIYFPLGYYAMCKKNIRILRYFVALSIYSAIAIIFLLYLNTILLITLIIRIALYIYTRHIIHLLVSILFISRRFNNRSYGGI